MSEFNLAQLNIAILKAPIDSPLLADFVSNLDQINELAEKSDGFVWRLKSDDNNATSFRPLGEDTIVNMSVWEDVDSLKEYVYKSAHAEFIGRRKEWFEKMGEAFMVLWWVPAGHIPTIDEALKKLELLKQAGASEEAFTFRNPFPKPNS